MPCLPYFSLDLAAQGLLPADWAEQVLATADAPERVVLATPGYPRADDGQFSIVDGAAVRARLGWLCDLYHGPLRSFVAQSLGRPSFAANRESSSITLNILEGEGAAQDWHADQTMANGVLLATALAEGGGGELEFCDAEVGIAQLRPRAGIFVCFRGHVRHRVAPLLAPVRRLSFPMVFCASVEDQPFASPARPL